jgi:hypothetical protein
MDKILAGTVDGTHLARYIPDFVTAQEEAYLLQRVSLVFDHFWPTAAPGNGPLISCNLEDI